MKRPKLIPELVPHRESHYFFGLDLDVVHDDGEQWARIATVCELLGVDERWHTLRLAEWAHVRLFPTGSEEKRLEGYLPLGAVPIWLVKLSEKRIRASMRAARLRVIREGMKALSASREARQAVDDLMPGLFGPVPPPPKPKLKVLRGGR